MAVSTATTPRSASWSRTRRWRWPISPTWSARTAEPRKGRRKHQDVRPCSPPDGVHLTPAGNRALAQCFLAAVAGKLRGGETIVCLGDSVTYGAGNRGAGTAEGDTYPAMLRGLPGQLAM